MMKQRKILSKGVRAIYQFQVPPFMDTLLGIRPAVRVNCSCSARRSVSAEADVTWSPGSIT
jgi:hypothetical protein